MMGSNGVLLNDQTLLLNKGSNTLFMQTGALSKGMYIIRLSGVGKLPKTFKLVIL